MRAILLLLQLWALVQTARANAKGPRLYMCSSFRVEHDKSVNVTGEVVEIILRMVTSPGNDSEEVSCYMPSQEYTGTQVAYFQLQFDYHVYLNVIYLAYFFLHSVKIPFGCLELCVLFTQLQVASYCVH